MKIMDNPFLPFSVAALPRIDFGDGVIDRLPDEVEHLGRRVLIVTGVRSFTGSIHWEPLLDGLKKRGIDHEHVTVTDEPSPEMVDRVVDLFRPAGCDVVLGIGGGSALDAAKAIAGLLPVGRSVMDYLEGVGPEMSYHGPSLPLVAAPTTAGTGSEATKNAVISRRGPGGFKKSFRSDLLMPRVAVVDPSLLATCPGDVMAADGMDAFTQLLESFVSIRANPLSEALAWSGLQAFHSGFFDAYESEGEAAALGRRRTAFASLTSGICLAQTGLGSVHGLAAPLGALFPVPHGIACGTLVAEATEINIGALLARFPDSPALEKYARVGRLLAGQAHMGREQALAVLVGVLREWTERLRLPRLGQFGITETDINAIVADSRGSSMRTNPLELTDTEIAEVVRRRI